MSIVFAVRGTQLNAYYNNGGGAVPFQYSTAGAIATGVSGLTGEIGGSSINMNLSSTANKFLIYPGRTNYPTNAAISILFRGSFHFLNSFQNLFFLGLPSNTPSIGTMQINLDTTGQIRVNLSDEQNGTGIANVATASGMSIDTIYDIVFTWDGTAAANAFKIYVNNVLLASLTSAKAWSSPKSLSLYPSIAIGLPAGLGSPQAWLQEFIMWDVVINPASVSCGGSLVALAGNTRSAFVDVSNVDGSNFVLPNAGDIRSGVGGLIYAGVAVTPTCVVPTSANTKHGVSVDVSGTGSYRGADLNDVVANTDLKHGVVKNQDGSSVTGTYRGADLNDVVAATDLKHGVTKNQDGSSVVGSYRGYDLFDDVQASQLEHGVVLNVDGSPVTGTYRAADLYDNVAATDLKHGVTKNQNGSSIVGSYRGADLWDPVDADQLKAGEIVNQDGNQITGDYAGEDLNDSIDASDLKHGVSKLNLGSTVVGSYRADDLWDPVAANELKHAVTKNQDGSIVVGTYTGADVNNTTVRDFLDAALTFIGSETLTDEEFGLINLSSADYDKPTFDELSTILELRDGVSDQQVKLRALFVSKGAELTLDGSPVAKSNIFIGGAL